MNDHGDSSQYISNAPRPDDYSMKWHNFLIYFALWAGAVLAVWNGFSQMTGSVYGGNKDAVYRMFPSLKGIDILFGVLMIGIAVFQIFVRFQLAGYKTDAPKKLLILYGLNAGVTVLYLLLASASTHISISELSSGSIISSVIGSVVMISVNKSYYEKRAALFIN